MVRGIEAFGMPVTFIVILLALALYAFRSPSKKILAIALCMLAIFMYIICSPIFAIALSQLLDYSFSQQLPPENEKAVLLVLGGGSSRDENGKPFQPTMDTMERLYAAVKLAKEHHEYSTMILSGGDIFGRSSISGADVMKHACEVMECPAKMIIEGKSRNTDENFKYSAEIIKQLNINNVIVVTSNYHMERSMDLAMKYIPAKIKLYAYPSGGNKFRHICFQPAMLIPNMDSLKFSYVRLREYIGIIVAKL